jgi:hypothetical protein
MRESKLQTLRETAARLNKAWAKNCHKSFEDEHFASQLSKRKLEKDRQGLHQAVDSVLTKRHRPQYREEEEALDSALSSGK